MRGAAALIFLIGVVALLGGLGMSEHVTKSESICTEPTGTGACYAGGYETVDYNEKNDMKVPVTVGGGIMTLVGLLVFAGTYD